MASDAPAQPAPPPRNAIVTEPTFVGFLWSGAAVSLCFLLFRLYVKIKSFRRLYSEDYVIIAAWGMLLATSVLWQTVIPKQYEQYAVASGRMGITPDLVAEETLLMHILAPITALFYTCLWAVKLSLLLFFQRLGSKVTGQKIWWWSILVVTVLTWAACIGDIHWRCMWNSFLQIEANCGTLASIHFDNRTFVANCVADVITDCLILSLPSTIVWRVRLPLRKKLILMAVFSLTVIVMAVSIIRVAVVHSPNQNINVAWMYFWSNVELTTSIIIACLVSFRQLFIANRHRKQAGNPGGNTFRRGLLSRLWIFCKSNRFSRPYPKHHARWPFSPKMGHESSSKSGSRAHFVPLDSIHVSHNMHFHSEFEPEV